jgi:cytochrome c553
VYLVAGSFLDAISAIIIVGRLDPGEIPLQYPLARISVEEERVSVRRDVIRVRIAALVFVCSFSTGVVAEEGKGDAEHGGKLFARYCRGCHGEEGKGDGLVFMPHVNNLTKKGYIENLPDDYLLLAISKGGPGIGKSNYMPAWEDTLQKQEMLDLVAYIRSLPTY